MPCCTAPGLLLTRWGAVSRRRWTVLSTLASYAHPLDPLVLLFYFHLHLYLYLLLVVVYEHADELENGFFQIQNA